MIGLGLGLLGAALGWGQLQRNQRAEEFAKVQQLLGVAPQGDQPGSGLAANPNDPAAQLAFARGIMGASPRYMEQGARLLESIYGRQQQAQQFGTSEGRLASQFDRSQQQAAEQFAAQEARLREQGAAAQASDAQRIALEQRRVQLAEGQAAAERAALAARGNAPAGLPESFKPPSGYVPWADPVSGQVAGVAPLPGTKDYASAVSHAEALNRGIESARMLVDQFVGAPKLVNGREVRAGGTGTEAWGPAAATMGNQRADVLSGIATLRNMGVLQEAEAKRLESILPDPVGWGYTSPKSFQKAYEEVSRQMTRALAGHYRANPWMVPPPPPGTVPQGGRAQ
jgi:hypothetical protein